MKTIAFALSLLAPTLAQAGDAWPSAPEQWAWLEADTVGGAEAVLPRNDADAFGPALDQGLPGKARGVAPRPACMLAPAR